MGNELAWWFNVGVQIFLCVSGFLFGQRHIEDIRNYYLNRLKRICVPFYIVLIPLVAINLACGKIDPSTAVQALLMNKTFPGAGHLWFVPTILFCYLITPILESFYMNASRKEYIITTLFALEIIAVFCYGFADFYSGAWIGCYVIGYAIGINEKKQFFPNRAFLILFGVLASFNIIQIYIDYLGKVELHGILGKVYSVIKLYNHVWLGVFLFLALKTIFGRLEFSQNTRRVLDITDKYSYETYLVHLILILGPFSLMALTPYLVLNIFIIIICIGVFAWILKQAETRVLKAIPQLNSVSAAVNQHPTINPHQ